MRDGQMLCRYCGVPFFHRWQDVTVLSFDAPRITHQNVGQVYATVCTSCEGLHLELEIREGFYGEAPLERQTVLPLPEQSTEAAIEIVVKIIIEFAAKKYKEDYGEEMPEDEKMERMEKAKGYFKDMWNYAKSPAGTVSILTKQFLDLLSGNNS